MTIQVSVGQTDDPDFVDLLNSLLRGILAARAASEVWIIQIDNWFDHKWLEFSGIGIVNLESPVFVGSDSAALDEFHQHKVTFPPFAPNRVLRQWSYVKDGPGYKEVTLSARPHSSEKRRSEKNLRRRVEDFSASVCFLWYSSNTLSNGRGSVMVYTVETEQVNTWFASFDRVIQWRLQATKGAGRGEVERLYAAPADTASA